MTGLILFLAGLLVLVMIIFFRPKAKTVLEAPLPANVSQLLDENVAYYRLLNPTDKTRFETKVQDFLSYVRVHGVNITIDELDKLLVACSAVIPIFGFDNWHYYNLGDVLLYAGTFDADHFSTETDNRNTLGMVGTGPMQRMMILSQPALREGFKNETDKSNTGIHEFVHLLDKADGDTDGVPEQLLSRQYSIPWIKFMSEEIQEIKKGHSDINVYGATNNAEFFAVASEYFFERPDLFKTKHPDLFNLLEIAFRQEPATMRKHEAV